MDKIRGGKTLSASDMESVSDSTRLRDIYNMRWWNENMQSFFVMYNSGTESLRGGEQVFTMYGNRSDDFLLE